MQDLKMFITYHCEVSLASKETVSHFPSVPEPINSMSELTKNICVFLSSHSPSGISGCAIYTMTINCLFQGKN